MSSLYLAKITPWTKGPLDKRLIGKLFLGQKSPWTTMSLDNRPLDNCCNTLTNLKVQIGLRSIGKSVVEKESF